MDFNAAIELIIKDLNDACRIIDDFKNYSGVPELHVELAKSKCKSSAEIIALLKKGEMVIPNKKADAIKKEPISEDKKFTEDVLTIEETIVEAKEIHAKIAEKQSEKERIKEVEVKPPTEKTIETQQKQSSIIADNFTDMPVRINEQLGSKKSKDDVSEIMKSKHISNLRSAIGLNDRFLLIREIFGGDKNKYEQAIAKLENTTSIADAKALISEYSNIDDANEALVLLLDLVKRKLNTDE